MLEEAPIAKGCTKLLDNFEEVPKAGLAYIQRYHFENGNMFYSAKYLRSEAYERNTAAQRIVVGEFGTARYPDPCKNIFHRYFSYFFEKTHSRRTASLSSFYYYCKMEQADGIMNALDLNAMRAEGIRLQSDKERAFLHRMIVPPEVSGQLKPGTDLLRNVSFAGKCRAIVEDDGKTIRLEDERLCSAAFEFPRYNYDLNAKQYRYCYGSHILADVEDLRGIVKADLAKRTHQLWNRDHSQQICAEPVFIPRPGASEETTKSESESSTSTSSLSSAAWSPTLITEASLSLPAARVIFRVFSCFDLEALYELWKILGCCVLTRLHERGDSVGHAVAFFQAVYEGIFTPVERIVNASCFERADDNVRLDRLPRVQDPLEVYFR